MSVDLTPVLEAVVSVSGMALTIAGSWALAKVSTRLNLSISSAQTAAFDDGVAKSLAWGISQTDAAIVAKGWGHVDVKNQVVASALGYMSTRFADSAAGVGVVGDIASAENVAKLSGALIRGFPAAATVAVASPATSPAHT